LLSLQPANRIVATALPLYITAPALTGLFHYLDARFHIRSDLSLLTKFINVTIKGSLAEKSDRLSPFYKLEEWAKSKTHAKKTFLHFGGKSWTYAESYQHVLQYGTWMKSTFGIQKGEVVAMDCMNSEMFIWIWFGLWSIGAKPAFINYNLTDRPLIHSIKTSTARVALVDEQVRSKYTEDVLNQFADVNFREGKGFCEVVFMDNVLRKGIDELQPMRFPDSDRGGQLLKDMAILIYTSGTTGLPKPAVVSWAKAGLAAMFVAKWLPIKTDDVMYTVSERFLKNTRGATC
jgi:acyl-CoA synthetase (AMP-forming)/AMP-acid ligase II